eukprot:TRINITY_DN22666_c0_g1_i1.p1 TRINITY_DN22666_c0_g1~~TRINITY_DN22666_c0_g1_i1.p1  ORF type:complete len:112 (+),score=45.45 TRINITY_DN22666_c0_g1_i1:104-439(+)
MIRRPPRSTQSRSSAASDVYKRQGYSFILSHHDKPVCRRHIFVTNPYGCVAWHFSELQLITLIAIVRVGAILEYLVGSPGSEAPDEPSGCCLLYTSPSPRDRTRSRMPSSA